MCAYTHTANKQTNALKESMLGQETQDLPVVTYIALTTSTFAIAGLSPTCLLYEAQLGKSFLGFPTNWLHVNLSDVLPVSTLLPHELRIRRTLSWCPEGWSTGQCQKASIVYGIEKNRVQTEDVAGLVCLACTWSWV